VEVRVLSPTRSDRSVRVSWDIALANPHRTLGRPFVGSSSATDLVPTPRKAVPKKTPSVEGVFSLIPASAKDRTQPRDRPLAECRHRLPLPAEPPSGRAVRCRLSFAGKRDPVIPFVAVVQMHTAAETSWRQVGGSRTALGASAFRMRVGLVALHTLSSSAGQVFPSIILTITTRTSAWPRRVWIGRGVASRLNRASGNRPSRPSSSCCHGHYGPR
jgi:hypothetical protein